MSQPRSRRRVLFLAPYLGDGGINTHMLTLGGELRQLGWEVGICSGGPLLARANTGADEGTRRERHEPVPRDYEDAGIAHFGVRFPFMPHRLRDLPELLRIPLAMWQVISAVRRFRPAVLHSHSRQMGIYARVVERLVGVPFVSTVHSPITPSNRLWSASALLGSRAMAVSDEIRNDLIRDYRMDPARIMVVPPGADADHFRPPNPEERQSARHRHGLQPGQFVLAFIGSLNANKRPDTLIDAIAVLRASGQDVVALLAGKGPEEQAIRDRVSAQRLGATVRLLGYQDARSLLWAADALVLPSQREGFGLVVAEGMLSGVVVLATPAGGASQQLTPGVTGFVFEVGDHGELARRIRELIERPELRASMAVRAREQARRLFSSVAMARTVAATYVEALNIPPG